MDFEGRKKRVNAVRSSGTWGVPTAPLRLAISNVFPGHFAQKTAVFRPKLLFLTQWSATSEFRSRPPALIFSHKRRVIVLHTHRYHPSKFPLDPRHHDGVLIFSHFARAACLLACCLLLLLNLVGPP